MDGMGSLGGNMVIRAAPLDDFTSGRTAWEKGGFLSIHTTCAYNF